MTWKKQDKKGKRFVKFIVLTIIMNVLLLLAISLSIAAITFIFFRTDVNKLPWWITFYACDVYIIVYAIYLFVLEKSNVKFRKKNFDGVSSTDADERTDNKNK